MTKVYTYIYKRPQQNILHIRLTVSHAPELYQDSQCHVILVLPWAYYSFCQTNRTTAQLRTPPSSQASPLPVIKTQQQLAGAYMAASAYLNFEL